MTDLFYLQCNFVIFILKTFLRIIHITDFLPSRELLTDIQLPDGKIMPAGTTYCIDLASLQLNKCVWGKDVLEFNPDRFETTRTHTYQETVNKIMIKQLDSNINFDS